LRWSKLERGKYREAKEEFRRALDLKNKPQADLHDAMA
jgi:hypothetical protein